MKDNEIKDRITALRLQKNVSEYKMSLDLGHSKSYIQSISSGRAMPSMSEFLSICDYLEITPEHFFAEDIQNPVLVQKALNIIKNLNDNDLEMIINLAKRLSNQ